jgi:hypothetical protein
LPADEQPDWAPPSLNPSYGRQLSPGLQSPSPEQEVPWIPDVIGPQPGATTTGTAADATKRRTAAEGFMAGLGTMRAARGAYGEKKTGGAPPGPAMARLDGKDAPRDSLTYFGAMAGAVAVEADAAGVAAGDAEVECVAGVTMTPVTSPSTASFFKPVDVPSVTASAPPQPVAPSQSLTPPKPTGSPVDSKTLPH